MRRREIDQAIAALVGFIFVALAVSPARAQDWPQRPVKIVVPYGPGGISDVLARMTADRLTKAFGQPFVIDNRGGAGGTIGTEYAARSPHDGYTLYLAGGRNLPSIRWSRIYLTIRSRI